MCKSCNNGVTACCPIAFVQVWRARTAYGILGCSTTRGSVIVALGLLGVSLPCKCVALDPEDGDGARTWVLSLEGSAASLTDMTSALRASPSVHARALLTRRCLRCQQRVATGHLHSSLRPLRPAAASADNARSRRSRTHSSRRRPVAGARRTRRTRESTRMHRSASQAQSRHRSAGSADGSARGVRPSWKASSEPHFGRR